MFLVRSWLTMVISLLADPQSRQSIRRLGGCLHDTLVCMILLDKRVGFRGRRVPTSSELLPQKVTSVIGLRYKRGHPGHMFKNCSYFEADWMSSP